ncbi:hypothetical protein Shyhy02_75890 [Streptomyces hygroscopicus subsp. hygroscopicus]|nr:hypothetical protein Shyhy02_75890 [Streptomyces hygroscopicus subsp. hygroscopicus]
MSAIGVVWFRSTHALIRRFTYALRVAEMVGQEPVPFGQAYPSAHPPAEAVTSGDDGRSAAADATSRRGP